MKYYHATLLDLAVGTTVSSNRKNTFYVKASEKMDASKPSEAPSRLNALFVSDNSEFAIYFLQKQGVQLSDIKLYEVEPDDPFKSPFAVTHEVEKRISKDKNCDELIKEYWEPCQQWNFFEYLTLSFLVVKQLTTEEPDHMLLGIDYDSDKRKVESFS
ncbi:hypothetical protein [Vibrio vulnificus]|uniref:hypothetical protein n=1 Tax=Vibrio vulnificus TaxID=672 RepID=UPI00102A227E|nr:hypothetical protein [Vibrio vulnificus]